MWTGSPALQQWHIALADMCWHTASCEQTAYGEWVSDEYAGRAVAP